MMEAEQSSLEDSLSDTVSPETASSDGVGQADAEDGVVSREDVREVVDERVREDVYPRLSKIYQSLEHEGRGDAELPDDVDLSPEIQRFYEEYTSAFDASIEELVAELLEEEARRLSEELEFASGESPDWLLER